MCFAFSCPETTLSPTTKEGGRMSSSTSTPKIQRRPKSVLQNPNFNESPSTASSSSTITSLLAQVEPPPNLLPSKSDFLKLIVVIAIAATVATACNFIADVFYRPPIPFCDSHVEYHHSGPGSCEPCPTYGTCYNGQLECIQGYRKYGKLCIEDGDISVTANKLSECAKNRLCGANAQYMCDGTGTTWASEIDLKSMLDDSGMIQSSTMDNITYMYIQERAMEYLSELLDTRTTDDWIKEFKCPDHLAESYKPITCRARQWIAKHLLLIIPVCALLLGCTLPLLRIRRRWYLTRRAEQLYHQVCDILEENALMSKRMGDREPWLVASRLRDHLLSPSERRYSPLWKMVEELVESDSRLDRYPKLVKGESKVVWEWQVEGSLSSARRKKEQMLNRSSVADMNRSSDQKLQ